ncbi:uncharacterized protein [Maniola hyperantus]|uniref:uncharacterized protein isoform X1 n=1 Tax=Aphantopus hyperantus TaxID=2795564 RepID=UPI003749E41D
MGLLFESDGTPYVMLGDNKIKLEKMPITEEFYVNKAKSELRETQQNIENGLRDLRVLLKREVNLIVPIDDDEFLIKFLRPTKYHAESAFKKIQAYYKFRLSHQDYCQDLYPSAVRLAFDHSIVSILSPRDQHGRRIMFVESGERWNPRQVPVWEVFRGVQLGLESLMMEPRTQVCGVSVILELQGYSFNHIMQLTPSFAKMAADWIQDCIPFRLKEVHIVNQPYIFNIMYAIFKPFLRDKLRSRIFFHGTDRMSLLKHIDGDALMQRIGGSLPEDGISGEVMWKMMHHYEESFRREANLVVPIDDDEFLLKFLRPTKYYAESAFKKIQAYYKFRLSHQDYCRDLYPSAVRLAFDHSIVSILSPRDQHGRRIMFVESGERWNPRHVPLREVFRGVQLGLESAMVEPRTQVSGVSVILELKGLSFSQVMQFTPSFAKMVVDWIQDCIPIRLKGVHIVNQPYIFNMLFAIFKPFLSDKLRSRIFFHGSDRKSLLKHIDGDALMQRIGGSLPDDGISGEVMWKMMHHYEESFRRAASYGYITNNNK